MFQSYALFPHLDVFGNVGRQLAWRAAQVAVRAAGTATLDGTVLARSYGGDPAEYLVQTVLGCVKAIAGDRAAPWCEGDAVGVELHESTAVVLG